MDVTLVGCIYRTCPGIEPDVVAAFPSYCYKTAEGADEPQADKSIAIRAVSTLQPQEETILAVNRRASEPALPSPRLGAPLLDAETIKYDCSF